MKQKFFDLPWQEQKKIAQERMYGGARFEVWDYCPDKEGNYGVIEQCPKAIDYGFIHGFKFTDPKVCALHHCYAGVNAFEINVYSDRYPEDETFETRSKCMWHIFTSLEKAQSYAARVKQLFPEHLSLEGILQQVKQVFPQAHITEGRRGYETGTKPYRVIVADGGWTTFKVGSDGLIRVQFGQNTPYIIPHTELIVPAFTDIKKGHSINYDYCINEDYWCDFYSNK